MAVVKNKTNDANRKYWSHVEEVAKEVGKWPRWMNRGDIAMNYDIYQIGDEVIARFTNCNRIREFRGRIVGKTKNYWKIESITSPYAEQGERPGRIFHISTIESQTFSGNNCIRAKSDSTQKQVEPSK